MLGCELTNRFQVAVHLLSNRSQMTSKCGTRGTAKYVTDVLTSFDVHCDLFLNRRMATWNLFVLYDKELKYTEKKF